MKCASTSLQISSFCSCGCRSQCRILRSSIQYAMSFTTFFHFAFNPIMFPAASFFHFAFNPIMLPAASVGMRTPMSRFSAKDSFTSLWYCSCKRLFSLFRITSNSFFEVDLEQQLQGQSWSARKGQILMGLGGMHLELVKTVCIPWVWKTSAGATFCCKHVLICLELRWPYIYWRLH